MRGARSQAAEVDQPRPVPAEGVDRFIADVAAILQDTKQEERFAPVVIPLEGLDY